MQAAMKFEFLPNEIIIDCFEYLNGPDLFDAFDQLNHRFQTLIRHIPLRLNFQHIKKSKFDQFCIRMLLNPEIQRQIYSLQLSNATDTCGQITAFLSFFSFDEFCHLRSLTLVDVKEKEMQKLPSMLPLLSNLSYFCFDSQNINDTIPGALPLANLRKLVVRDLFPCSILTQKTTFITYLTVYSCAFDNFYNFLNFAPMLKYLNVKNLCTDDGFSSNEICLTNPQAVCLTQLSLRLYNAEWKLFEILLKLLKQTPKLEILTLSTDSYTSEIVDAARWQDLISLLLPHLRIFKFYFAIWSKDSDASEQIADIIVDKFQQFQTHFWHQQHHWYTAYELETRGVYIFTIPCIEDAYVLTYSTNLYHNTLMTDSKLFGNVTDLTLDPRAITKQSHIQFSSVTSLTLEREDVSQELISSLPETNMIESLRMIINLSNLKHLDIERHCGMESPLILLQILKETPQLSSMRIYKFDLMPLLDNDELCKYLHKMITKLNIQEHTSDPSIVFHMLARAWKIFSNLEQLKCEISSQDDLLVLFSRLPRLTNVTVFCATNFSQSTNRWLQNHAQELKENFLLDVDGNKLDIWIGRHTS